MGDEKAHVHSFPGVGEANWNDGAPAVSADPNYMAPAVSAQPSYTCPECGEEIVPGTAHGHGVCGLPLAPDTHVCEVCGQTLRVGMEHSHQQEHHSEHH